MPEIDAAPTPTPTLTPTPTPPESELPDGVVTPSSSSSSSSTTPSPSNTAPIPQPSQAVNPGNNLNGIIGADNNHGLAAAIGPLNNNNMNRTRNNNNQNPLFNVRDRLFHALFIKAALAYARAFPRPIRRFIEFIVLLKAIMSFFVLAYIHIVFSRAPTSCLEHIRDDWPRDGILRVEILRSGAEDYSIEKSYAKEEKLRQEKVDDLASVLGILARDGFLNIEPSAVEEGDRSDPETEGGNEAQNFTRTEENVDIASSTVSSDIQSPNLSTTNATISPPLSTKLWDGPNTETLETASETVEKTTTPPTNSYENVTEEQTNEDANGDHIIQPLKGQVSEVEKIVRAVFPEDEYIVEYSLEYGFLRLSPAARQRLNIPVKIVTLDPSNEKCFGDAFSRLILDEFLGYDDLLMASIKTLAEHEDNKGYLRNVVTGEHYRFVSMWMARTSYLAAFFIMLVFTVSISMLLRYSHHQIFVFIDEKIARSVTANPSSSTERSSFSNFKKKPGNDASVIISTISRHQSFSDSTIDPKTAEFHPSTLKLGSTYENKSQDDERSTITSAFSQNQIFDDQRKANRLSHGNGKRHFDENNLSDSYSEQHHMMYYVETPRTAQGTLNTNGQAEQVETHQKNISESVPQKSQPRMINSTIIVPARKTSTSDKLAVGMNKPVIHSMAKSMDLESSRDKTAPPNPTSKQVIVGIADRSASPDNGMERLRRDISDLSDLFTQEITTLKEVIIDFKDEIRNEVGPKVPCKPKFIPAACKVDVAYCETLNKQQYRELVQYLRYIGGLTMRDALNNSLKECMTDKCCMKYTYWGTKTADSFYDTRIATAIFVDLLQMLEFNVTVSFPAAPLLTVILALVGMEAIMSEFFNDTTTAFYIILIVWIADQYDAICCHTTVTKRHWLRFFYLYHFSFYAYHYRFNGQYSSLALVTSWLFIQHSMMYFFHHYELPVILQQAQLQQLLLRNHGQPAQPPTPSTAPTTPGPSPTTSPSPSPTPGGTTGVETEHQQTQRNYVSELSQLDPVPPRGPDDETPSSRRRNSQEEETRNEADDRPDVGVSSLEIGGGEPSGDLIKSEKIDSVNSSGGDASTSEEFEVIEATSESVEKNHSTSLTVTNQETTSEDTPKV